MRKLQYCRDNVDLEVEKVPNGLQDDTQMCAGGGADNQDTCQVHGHSVYYHLVNYSRDLEKLFAIFPGRLGRPSADESLPVRLQSLYLSHTRSRILRAAVRPREARRLHQVRVELKPLQS